AHGKAVDIGTVERRRIDRSYDIDCEHARQRRAKTAAFTAKRREIDAGVEPAARLVGGDHFEELLLPRGALDRIDNRRDAPFGFRVYGHGLTATGVPAANPSLSAGMAVQTLLPASACSDR